MSNHNPVGADWLRSIFYSIGDAVITTDNQGRVRQMNPVAETLTGWSEGQAHGQPLEQVFRIISEETRVPVESPVRRVLQEGVVVGLANHTLLLSRDGKETPISDSGAPVRDAQGEIGGVVLVFRDQTQERRSDALVREARFFAESIIATVREPLLVLDATLCIQTANRAFYKTFHVEPDDTLGHFLYELGDRQWNIPVLRVLLENLLPQNTSFDNFEVDHVFPHIGRRTFLLNARRIYRDARKTEKILLALEDVTERKELEATLRRTSDHLTQVTAASPAILYALTIKDNRFEPSWISDNAASILGYERSEMLERGWWYHHVHPDDRPGAVAQGIRLLRGEQVNHEYRFLHKNGSTLWIRDEMRVVCDADNQPCQVIGAWLDVTDRKRLEEQFHHSQRLEAVGRLAGGIAHDFNNLLTVISGYSEILLTTLPRDDPKREAVQLIHEAGARAAQLTRQLLAFSRQMVLQPEILDVNDSIFHFEKMLRRLIGEDINLSLSLDPQFSRIKVDPGQLGQVLLNLAVNARDAMPKGGMLTIETRTIDLDESYCSLHREASPGTYVLIAMTDTGCGIPPEIRPRIFEPFFTTKAPDRGTGLGLATVYGIIKQSGGLIEVYSEVGVGTTFKLYFPAVMAQASFSHSTPAQEAVRGNESVLLVEDEETVRAIAQFALQSHGYNVQTAVHGRDALRVINGGASEIDLLITDVVMPEISGRELAEHLRVRYPNLKVLFISGYTDDAIVRHGLLHGEVAFLQKPFTPLGLAKKAREVLDYPPRPV